MNMTIGELDRLKPIFTALNNNRYKFSRGDGLLWLSSTIDFTRVWGGDETDRLLNDLVYTISNMIDNWETNTNIGKLKGDACLLFMVGSRLFRMEIAKEVNHLSIQYGIRIECLADDLDAGATVFYNTIF